MNSSFASAQLQISKLRTVLERINSTIGDINEVFDQILDQTGSVDKLIGSLQKTVATQTGKNPDQIAEPLSVKLENQYTRSSFVDFLMPQVISISLLLSCFLLASISLVKEKTNGTIIRALMAPGSLKFNIWKINHNSIVNRADIFDNNYCSRTIWCKHAK